MIQLGGNKTTADDFRKVLFFQEELSLSEIAENRVKHSYEFLEAFCKGKVIYGINTGFGPMAPYRINQKHQKELQYNLIRSHSSGSGAPLPDIYIRAVIMARLSTLLLGYSGIHSSVPQLLKDMLNHKISPLIFEHGGVGASGDLVQLAHLALGLIGEGESYHNGKMVSTQDALKSSGLNPVQIHIREGLGVMNGTAAMTGIGIINLIYAQKLVQLSIVTSCMLNEIVGSFGDHFSYELNHAKLHSGQRKIALAMREHLSGSSLIRERKDHLYTGDIPEEDIMEDKVQEYYSLRCVPQVLGPIFDTLAYSENVLIEEVNSANDNPVIDVQSQNVYHGGNFHGDYVALEMDKMRIAVTKLSMLAERQLNYLMNHKLNNILPPFANLGRLGLNFGMQGVQFTAVSTTAENQTLSNPMYIHSIPNNNDNQDIVSMGSNSALLTKKVIDNSFEVMAIHAMAMVQAIDYLEISEKMSPASLTLYNKVREIMPVFKNDEPKYKIIAQVTEMLKKIEK